MLDKKNATKKSNSRDNLNFFFSSGVVISSRACTWLRLAFDCWITQWKKNLICFYISLTWCFNFALNFMFCKEFTRFQWPLESSTFIIRRIDLNVWCAELLIAIMIFLNRIKYPWLYLKKKKWIHCTILLQLNITLFRISVQTFPDLKHL